MVALHGGGVHQLARQPSCNANRTSDAPVLRYLRYCQPKSTKPCCKCCRAGWYQIQQGPKLGTSLHAFPVLYTAHSMLELMKDSSCYTSCNCCLSLLFSKAGPGLCLRTNLQKLILLLPPLLLLLQCRWCRAELLLV